MDSLPPDNHSTLLLVISNIVTSAISGIGAWFIASKQIAKSNFSDILDANIANMESYMRRAKELEDKVDKQQTELYNVRKELLNAVEEIHNLTTQIRKYKDDVEQLTKSLDYYKKRTEELNVTLIELQTVNTKLQIENL